MADDRLVRADPAVGLAQGLAPRLALLRAVAAEGHLGRGAARAGVPQPTASRWLAELSDRLGTPVLAHHGRRIVLTRAGLRLAESAETALTAIERGTRLALAEADPDRGHVSFAFLPTTGGVWVPELLRDFRQRHPAVGFTLRQGGHDELVQLVVQVTVDLALCAPLPRPDPTLAVAALTRQPLVLVVPAEHRLAHRRRARLAELAAESFVGFRSGFGLRQITDELSRRAGFTPRMAFEGEEADTVRGLVAAGLGIAVLPAAAPAPVAGTVELRLPAAAARTIGLIWSAQRPGSPAAERFRDFVRARGRI